MDKAIVTLVFIVFLTVSVFLGTIMGRVEMGMRSGIIEWKGELTDMRQELKVISEGVQGINRNLANLGIFDGADCECPETITEKGE